MKRLRWFIVVICFFVPCCLVFSIDQITDNSNDGMLPESADKPSPDLSEESAEHDNKEFLIMSEISAPVDTSGSNGKAEEHAHDDLDDEDHIAEGPDIEEEIRTEIRHKDDEPALETLFDPSDIGQMEKLKIEIAVKPSDVILLKNGESIEGVIRDKTQNIVSIETEFGLKVYTREEIDFIDEITEKERFYLLDKIEALQMFHKKAKEQKLKQDKRNLQEQEKKAQQQTEMIEKITDQEATNLFSLTNLRLEEIIKEFSQFPPEYWRYYHRKGDAQKVILRLRRLERFAHPQILETIKLYLQAFEYKIKELDEPDDSLSRENYEDNYKKFFRNAEKRRMVLKDTQFN